MSDVLLIQRFHKTTITVDGRKVRVLVDRLNVEQFAAFSRELSMHDSPAWQRAVAIRKPGEEQEKRSKPSTDRDAPPDEEFVIPEMEIQARRLAEMPPDERAAWVAAHEADTAAAADFLRRTAAHVHLEPGQVKAEQADGSLADVTEATQLLEWFGSPALGRSVIAAVWSENNLPSAAKNAFRSLLDSGDSFVERDLAAVGIAPEPRAESAGPRGSVTTGAAMASIAGGSSGPKGRLRSKRARSSRSPQRSLRPSVGLR